MGFHLTTISGGERLTTTRQTVADWAATESIVSERTGVARQFTLSRSGDVVMHLVVDDRRAHLSLWDGDTCHYLCGDRTDVDAVDLGWNAYPAWSISERAPAIAAAGEFVVAGRLAPTARWRSELVEL